MTQKTKYPLEFYGAPVSSQDLSAASAAMAAQHCPFLKRRCVKQRKSDATQTIGACIVSHAGASLIICPHRFIAHDQIFHDCIPLLAADVSQPHFYIVPEIKIPGGTVDYFLVTTDGSVTLDYAGIEIQSLDTTGSGGIWQAREDIRQGQLDATYSYGINWRMSAKTILMQMHHKALSFERLGKKPCLLSDWAKSSCLLCRASSFAIWNASSARRIYNQRL